MIYVGFTVLTLLLTFSLIVNMVVVDMIQQEIKNFRRDLGEERARRAKLFEDSNKRMSALRDRLRGTHHIVRTLRREMRK